MFRFHRTAHISRGNALEATQWAKEVAEYINQAYEPVNVRAYTEVFGDLGTIHWYSDFEDLASLEKFNGQINTDQEYLALVSKAEELFVEGSIHDKLVQAI